MSSSYLGHGAKYWADRYFEQYTQTRLPDDPADLSWREKYLALEKECEHYQATLSEMRVEVEYLCSQQPTSIVADPELQQKSEKWRLGYLRLSNTLKEKESQCDALSSEAAQLRLQLQKQSPVTLDSYNGHPAEWWYNAYHSACQEQEKLRSQLRPLAISLQACKESSEIAGHDAVYWCGQTQNLQKAISKKESQTFVALILSFIVAAIIAILTFMAGSGYFVPYYTPASPYLNGLKVAEETAYSTGRHDGFVSGYDAASAQNHNSSYNSGWHDGYSYCQEENQSIRNEYDSGYSVGYDSGWDDGWDAGHDDGLADGYQDAYDEGYDAGYSDCFDEYN